MEMKIVYIEKQSKKSLEFLVYFVNEEICRFCQMHDVMFECMSHEPGLPVWTVAEVILVL